MRQENKKYFWWVALVLIFSMSTLIILANLFISPIIVDESIKKAELHSRIIEEELNTKFADKSVLTRDIAQLSSSLPLDRAVFLKQIGNLITSKPDIAGGGIWPEPSKMITGVDKAALFWAKNDAGEYLLDEGYNQPSSKPYQEEFWYINAKNSPLDECIWSKAYIDPFSDTPMVTCSVRIDRDQQFWGVATIDIELTGIAQILEEMNSKYGIYGFLIDNYDQVISAYFKDEATQRLHTLAELKASNSELLPLIDALNSGRKFSEFNAGSVLPDQEALLFISELNQQKWRIGIIFPEVIVKKNIKLLTHYMYGLIALLAIIFASEVLLILALSLWNWRLIQSLRDKSKKLADISLKDHLTSLRNKTSLLAELEQRMYLAKDMAEKQFAVLFVGLDNFKSINNRFGLYGGDHLLKSVAERLKSSVRESDFIFRFGGDEFVIITENTRGNYNVESVCAHLLNAMKDPFNIKDSSVNITLSIGVAMFGQDGEWPNELLRSASLAMREAKNITRNSFLFSSSAMNERTQRKMLVEEHLLKAIERREISVAFQPIVALKNSTTRKFEVLARWTNPTIGQVPPDEFIPLAEHNGYIIPLGEHVLQLALEVCARIRRTYKHDFTIAVNVSPKQFNDPLFASKVFAYLETYGLPPATLTLEITEGVLIDNKEKSDHLIQQLLEGGVKLAMDDFGTGYSSLSYVRNYLFDVVKIDKEFIEDLGTDLKSIRLVETVLAMAKGLNIDVVAEGIENTDQLEILKLKNCKFGQGYLFSRPMDKAELNTWLIEGKFN